MNPPTNRALSRFIPPLLALAGIIFAIVSSIQGARSTPPAAPLVAPPAAPFESFVAGAGIVEASTENISIGTGLPGVIAKIHVALGSVVRPGDPLFTIDDRSQLATVAVRRAAVQYAKAQLADSANQLSLGTKLTSKKVLSIEERDNRRFAFQKAEAQLAQAEADLLSATTDLDRLTVRAPVEAQILQLKLHLGEFMPAGALSPPLLLLGSLTPLHLRVDIDENDAWRMEAHTEAVAYLRGNSQVHTILHFVRFEPYVVPKVSLTGSSTERVDTRVLQVIYRFERGALPINPGQQMDVYISSPNPLATR